MQILVDRFNISLSALPSRVKIRKILDDLRRVYITHFFVQQRSGSPDFMMSLPNFKLRGDLEVIDIDFAETLFIEICKPRGRNIIVGVIYRPPDRNLDLFLQQFNELMLKISRENKIGYLMAWAILI